MKRAVAILLLAGTACSLAPIDLASERSLPVRTTITAADGTFLARLYRQNRVLVTLSSVPNHLVDAVIAAEDSRFFEHSGYDLRAIARAALINLSSGDILQGGSTITQQYVKNTFLSRPGRSPRRTLARKARELRIALEIERRFTKRQILERYLNTVYFGEGAYGVKAAAETYFGHGVGRLSLVKSALLAGLIKAPALYDPRDHPRRARMRRRYVLDRMVTLDMVAPHEARAVARGPLAVTDEPPKLPTRQPYFVEAVKREILSDVRFGSSDVDRANALWKGGLRVTTTLDPKIQRAAERAVESHLNAASDPAAAVVAIRPRTGEIVAMVGGRDWKTSQVNLALGKAGGGSGRQPGSSFKPIAVAAALEAGIGFETRYESSPGVFHLADGSTWTVSNAEGTAAGTLPLDEALVHSVNGVFARLALDLGPGSIAAQAERMGVRARLPSYPSIALGSTEVSVLDMATAYATLANYGNAIEPTTIRSIRTQDGGVLQPEQKTVEAAVTPGNAYLVTKVLEEVIRRGTGRAAQIGRPAAGKTGTTDDHADAWFVGYTPDLVAAVWVGYPQGRVPMTSVHGTTVWGGNIPASIWSTFMSEALRGTPPRRFPFPEEELVRVAIDPKTGLLATEWCPGEMKTMLRQLLPTAYCPSPSPPATRSSSPSPRRSRDASSSPDREVEEPERSPSPSP